MAKKPTRKVARKDASKKDPLAPLAEIAANTWWSWNPRARGLFRYADAETFIASNRNPIVMLRKLSAKDRKDLARDAAFKRNMKRVHGELRNYLRRKSWYYRMKGKKVPGVTAYFCMEYAIHESLPLYAGGLGVLAGDHLKSASDLGLPLVAVGIYWRKGYTRQSIDTKGRQLDAFPNLPVQDTPLHQVCTANGRPWRLKLPMGKRRVAVRAWRLDVGRVPLYLLDTDLPDNKPKDRALTQVLYSGDRDTRIRQEILLGIGGWRLLRALDVPVTACHLNEGHAAFLSLERIAERMKEADEDFDAAAKYVTNTTVFTTHTPVPAGNEEFEPKLAHDYLGGYVRKLGISQEAFYDLARVKAGNHKENYGMTPLALHTSRYANGVAELHGKIARQMWKELYPGKTVKNVPIGHITNGIHLRTWLHPKMAELYDNLFGADWDDKQDRDSLWRKVASIPDADLWALHSQFKSELVAYCRRKVYEQLRRARGRRAGEAEQVLDPDALTIGFARRFAPYKRATLVFHDARRFARILNDKKRPVQIIFAGKAHPADEGGKALIEKLVNYSRDPRFRARVVFLEDYDMDMARHMVAGVDVWLNNPQRPREASGTSGMKPALHGGLNLSILDGWWPEGFNGRNGWAIGRGKDHDGTKAADARDARDLYRTLEKEVVPLYYDRTKAGLPSKWIKHMKNAMATVPPYFNTHRQVKEYLKRYYLPAMRNA